MPNMQFQSPGARAPQLQRLGLTLFQRLLGLEKRPDPLRPLYDSIVGVARNSSWYREGAVPDTLDGRFDMIAAVLALVLLRMEDVDARSESARLTEIFIADMDGSMRQIGIGDLMVGKHVGRMMGALGGRLAAFRGAAGGSLREPVLRNIFDGAPPAPQALDFVTAGLERLRGALAATSAEALLAGKVTMP